MNITIHMRPDCGGAFVERMQGKGRMADVAKALQAVKDMQHQIEEAARSRVARDRSIDTGAFRLKVMPTQADRVIVIVTKVD